MSFPRLQLEGSITDRTITDIIVVDEGNLTSAFPDSFQRAKYDVTRQFSNFSASIAGVPKRSPDVPYDYVRFIHTFYAYVDVLTSSVVQGVTSPAFVKKNISLIDTAMFLDMRPDGIRYDFPDTETANLGREKPNTFGGDYQWGYQVGRSWKYDETNGLYTGVWAIKNINIQDNFNNTSRVNFVFEIAEPWEQLKPVLDDIYNTTTPDEIIF